ncbi:MAG: amino acid adenylation domain-containing protein [Chloroflexi bacterium]|nr:amino acid adenylation domain-containing protein [Chloroflexota bacterium]
MALPISDNTLRERSNLTNTQFLIWLGQKLDPDAPLYNMIQAFAFDGAIDRAAFQRAFQALINQSDALRTVVVELDGAPQQRVLPQLDYAVEWIDLSRADDPPAAFAEWLDARRARVCDLRARLFESCLVQLAPARFVWYLNQHHLITDGWSFVVVYKRMAELYARALQNDLRDLPARPTFREYADYERAFRATPQFAQADAYWRAQTPASQPIEFFNRVPASRGARTERVALDLGAERSAQLRALANAPGMRLLSQDLSLYAIFATLMSAYLHRVSGNARLTIGVPFHNRATAAHKDTVGVFIEICPLTFEVADDDTFASLHKKVSREVLNALRYAQPGVSSAERNRAYEILLNYVNVAFPDFAGMTPQVEWIHAGYGDSNHSLRLQVHDFGATGNFTLHFDLNASVFDEAQRAWTIQQFLRVVDAFLADRARVLNAISLQSDAEHQALVVAYNRTATPYPAEQTVVALFEQQAAQNPDDIAIEFEGARLTYAELNARANQLAHHLRGRGIAPEQRVVIYMAHSSEVVVAILGVLKAGGAYVPVDPAYPPERLALILADTRAPMVLTQSHLKNRVLEFDGTVLCLDTEFLDLHAARPITNSQSPINSDSLAYVIYTSGSTGKPKGVMIEHRALTNYIWWAKRVYTQGERLAFPLFSSLSFDLTVTSIFTPLISGGRLVVYRDDPDARGTAILKVIADNAVDIIKLTPAHLALIRDSDLRASRVRALIVGGEDFKTELARAITRAFDKPIEIYNEYGPTEATVGCMIHRFDAERDRALSVPIGKPADNAQIYVLDQHLNPTPTGVIGEMYIAGDGLARGYFGRDDLTAERFLNSRFPIPNSQLRLYKTGDLARWLAGGQLEFLGRADHQVKVGGARIELGEIEARLLAHSDVRECVVDVVKPARVTQDVFFCARCGLASNFPGASYDANGVCNFCRAFDTYKDKAQRYFKTMDDLRAIVAQMRAARAGKYDCIALLSGGKDSTYMLYRLVELGLTPLVFSLDNGYISESAKANIVRVVQALGVDHVFGTTPHMNAIFADSLKQYANVCNGCFKTIYTLAVNLAREQNIRYIVTGLSRGQFFETRLTEDVFLAPDFDPAALDQAVIAARKAYHRRDDVISHKLDVDVFRDDALFDNIQFVDFYRYCDVSLAEVYAFLTEHAPWIRPADTGRSTNCLINEVGIYLHKKQRGFHNYALPYSWDVRLGHKTRDAALQELDDDIDAARVQRILNEIGYVEPAQDAETNRLAAYFVSDKPLTPAELRAHLAQQLPAFMLPAHFIRLDKLPLTPNGKVDRQALPRPGESRPELSATFVAPRTPTEKLLAEIWRKVLRIERVGIHDNFFELGGDSILNIQTIARANQVGLKLTPSQLFQHQTIAELASVAVAQTRARAEQGVVTGDAPLTPIQHWFFEQNFADAHHWNQTLQLDITKRTDPALLANALRHLLAHHDALRSRFTRDENGWRQTLEAGALGLGPSPNVTASGAKQSPSNLEIASQKPLAMTDGRDLPKALDAQQDVLDEIDLSHLRDSAQETELARAADKLQTSLDFERGRMLRALWVNRGDAHPPRLVIAAHHLAVDGVAWWVLLKDLETACDQLEEHRAVALPPKTTSFKQWSEKLSEYAGARVHRNAWLTQTQDASIEIPFDARGDNAQAHAATISIALDVDDTRRLMREVAARFNAQINDLLLTALAHTLSDWTGRAAHTITLEGHGREDLFAEVDLSRTVGWFTAIFPVNLTARAQRVETLKQIKETLRALPNHGLDYGVLRYLANDAALAVAPHVLFNYLGQFDAVAADSTRFQLAGPLQLARSPRAQRPYALEVNAHIADDALRVDWTFGARLHQRATIEQLAQNYRAHLCALIDGTENARALTPSDFPEARLNQTQLDEILAEFTEP